MEFFLTIFTHGGMQLPPRITPPESWISVFNVYLFQLLYLSPMHVCIRNGEYFWGLAAFLLTLHT